MDVGRVFAVTGCMAAVVAVGAGSAFAGEVTGNGKPTSGPAHANSICVFSGQNDVPEGSPTEGIGGISQSYGQDVKEGSAFPDGVEPIDPSTQNPGKVGQDVFTLHPGFACNGEHGFFAGGE
jgi:hypothetical protein